MRARAGSIGSIGSAGSIGSIGSVGSIFSVASRRSFGAVLNRPVLLPLLEKLIARRR